MAAAARAGRLRRNFQGYTDDTAAVLIGIGASAISRFPQGYAQNLSASSRYGAAMDQGLLATERGHAMTADDRLRADMIEDLMCRFTLDLPALAARHAVPLSRLRQITATLSVRFAAHLSDSGDVIRLTDGSRLIARLAAQCLDARALPEGRHSRAL
jgi:oxygen-independent coproporphyrinogen-3 oxidase